MKGIFLQFQSLPWKVLTEQGDTNTCRGRHLPSMALKHGCIITPTPGHGKRLLSTVVRTVGRRSARVGIMVKQAPSMARVLAMISNKRLPWRGLISTPYMARVGIAFHGAGSSYSK